MPATDGGSTAGSSIRVSIPRMNEPLERPSNHATGEPSKTSTATVTTVVRALTPSAASVSGRRKAAVKDSDGVDTTRATIGTARNSKKGAANTADQRHFTV